MSVGNYYLLRLVTAQWPVTVVTTGQQFCGIREGTQLRSVRNKNLNPWALWSGIKGSERIRRKGRNRSRNMSRLLTSSSPRWGQAGLLPQPPEQAREARAAPGQGCSVLSRWVTELFFLGPSALYSSVGWVVVGHIHANLPGVYNKCTSHKGQM